MSYRNLEIWQEARTLSIDIHKMTLRELSKVEMYEEGSQIRKSSKSVRSNIVEGYGRRKYQQEYVRFLTFSIASNDETTDHLDTLYETGSLKNKELYQNLIERLDKLGRKLNNFIGRIERDLARSKKQEASSQKPVARSK